jgi:hypothetical protein
LRIVRGRDVREHVVGPRHQDHRVVLPVDTADVGDLVWVVLCVPRDRTPGESGIPVIDRSDDLEHGATLLRPIHRPGDLEGAAG